MKSICYYCLLVLFIAACGNATKTTKEEEKDPYADMTPEEELHARIQEGLKEEANDTLILDHTFGMTRKDVVRYKDKLVKKKKVYGVYKTKNTRVFVYDLKLPKNGKTRVYFDTFYNEGELYRIECKPKIPKSSTSQKIMDEVLGLFKKKYGPPHVVVPLEDIEGCDRHIWVFANQQIEIRCDDKETMISYTESEREQDLLDDL